MAQDAALLLRDGSTALTATGNGTGVEVNGFPLRGMAVVVIVPQAAGTAPTLDLKVQVSEDNAAWKDHLTFPQITAAGKYVARMFTDKRYVRYAATVGGTTPNFGNVVIAVTDHEEGAVSRK